MNKIFRLLICVIAFSSCGFAQKSNSDLFPDGTKIPDWFTNVTKVELKDLGKQYILTDFGVLNDSTIIQTAKIQKVIDQAAKNGGGVIVIPKGTYLSGALFFKPKTHLHVVEGGV
ncbi:MAG: glycosyl hydrolase family 28-related protein, partial [Pelobium sp.]